MISAACQALYYYKPVFSHRATILWGRLATCGRLLIGLQHGHGNPTDQWLSVRNVGQPILAAAGFQPALFACAPVGFRRQRHSRQGPFSTRVNASAPILLP